MYFLLAQAGNWPLIQDIMWDREYIERMKAYYDHRAPWHDSYMSYTTNEAMKTALAPVIAIVRPLVEGRRVLELACGTGNWTRLIAPWAASILAVDSSPQSLAIARDKVGGIGQVELKEGDAFDLTGIEDNFDVVLAADWYSHIPNGMIPQFWEGAVRRLATGGAVILVDLTEIEELRREFLRVDSDGNTIAERILPDGARYEVVKNYPTEQEIRRAVATWDARVEYRIFEANHRWGAVVQFG